jgi:hypothetical protein
LPIRNIVKNPNEEPRVETRRSGIKSTRPKLIKLPRKSKTTSLGDGGNKFSMKEKKKATPNIRS